jgi:radical SAM/Cys-rich protein
MSEFVQKSKEVLQQELTSKSVEIVQVNVGLRCNQQCRHCHVSASPQRDEIMTWSTMERILAITQEIQPKQVDITGGAPELNVHFKKLVVALKKQGHAVQVRTNLSVFFEPGMAGLPEFYAKHNIQLVASMPCYLEENVTAQRGPGVYRKSVDAIKLLNALGYGRNAEQVLNLVYNPGGPSLPPDQKNLEKDYKRELKERFEIDFSNLITITNMPIGKFLTTLQKTEKEQEYWSLLKNAFNPLTLENLMCRNQISIAWDGTMYDCDFNYALNLPVNHGAPNHIKDFDLAQLKNREIVIADHCFGCTAGCGSSCAGAIA